MRRFRVTTADIGVRADVFLSQKYPDFSRSSLKKLFDEQKIQINQSTAKPGIKLRQGDKLSVDDKVLSTEPKAIELPILYEDRDVVVIDKPAGLLTHSKGALNTEPTVASFLGGKIDDKSLKGNRAGIVHRLDRVTSGVIIGAKNSAAQQWLQKQFSQRKAKKTYLAVVEGAPKPNAAIIDAPIGRNPAKPQSFKVIASGRSAQTEYRTIKTFEKSAKKYSLIEIRPLTGRTHQIRVHLSYIGHPIAGDAIYGHGGESMLLHATELALTLPNGQKKRFIAVPPAKFKEFTRL